jgi:methionyl-tRNA formyltransferase
MQSDLPWPAKKTISIVVDPPGWFTPFGKTLVDRLCAAGHLASLVECQADVPNGDMAFYLSCMGLTPADRLARNSWNIVVHASDLPRGRGFSPLVWQVLEGIDTIPVTMITMADEADAGDILMQRFLECEGHELNDEMREAMASMIINMCFDVATADAPPDRIPQSGAPSWYPRRRPEDSRLDIEKSLREQFALLRVVDNERYPAYFDLNGHRYVLKIERMT